MSTEKATVPNVPAISGGGSTTPSSAATTLPPLFRRIDWLTFLITFGAVWLGFYLTLAPEVTLEDSGELATGSFYAGIPHPPGYPVWSVYTWLWTVLVPFGNVAWRVALGEATGGALAAGLLGLLVSRGSSMLMEGIEELKAMAGRWENAICIVSGFTAGMLLGFNGFMWSQSVIVEVYAFSVASLMVVLVCLLRWIYAPHQRRYLYWALFMHGICFTNHQTLIVAAMGIEVAIAAADFRLGRYLWLGNSIIFLGGWFLCTQHDLPTLEGNRSVYGIFQVVGWSSIAAYVWFTFLSKETFQEFCMDGCMAAALLCLAVAPVNKFFAILAIFFLAGWIKFAADTWKLGWEWLVVILLGFCWIFGALFYFYMPLSGMTNPPMEWGYPRTVEGFIHAFTRGQYEKTNPTDIIGHPDVFMRQLMGLGSGIVEEFNLVYAFLALVPFVFFFKMHKRERAWLIGLSSIYLCLGVLLLILLNPAPDRQSQELNRVFFTSSHTVISILVGYGLTLIAAFMATNYQRFRSWGIIGGVIALALALCSFYDVASTVYFGDGASPSWGAFISVVGSTFTNKDQYGLPVYAGLILVGMAALFLGAVYFYRSRAPLAITLGLFALMPVHSIMTHWADNEERNHWFGYWFGHDMFTPPFKGADAKPLYPDMPRNAILFGGTDPGRFCPTYMIFCDSFLPDACKPTFDPRFDRRDVYLITQNALADGTYLSYIRAQYFRSAQIDPPFFQELFRPSAEREQNYSTNALARAAQPLDRFFTDLGDRVEKRRRAGSSLFSEKDFVDLAAFAGRLSRQQDPLSKYLYENLKSETRQLLGSGNSAGLARSLAADLNQLLERELQSAPESKTNAAEAVGPLYTPERFNGVRLSEYLTDFIRQNPRSHTRIRLNRLLLEAAYPKELARSPGGVYPDREIYTPSPEDSQECFQTYLADAQKRLIHDDQYPNEPKQIKPGEDVKLIDNKVQVSGQVAVMAINGFLTKVIFDHNPKNEFFVEESFPLDWMYPYLSPFGIIMKINRQPLPELSEAMVKRDHEFWTQYSKRLIGDWITYDTPVSNICKWVEKTYLRRDFSGFTGDPRFVRDDQGQKAFSKLRSSIGGIYAWRVSDPSNHNQATQQRMMREADFALRQAFAFCPYSPEAVFRFVNLLLSVSRFDDAYMVASTCLKLDPNNKQVADLVERLQGWRKQSAAAPAPSQNLDQLKKAAESDPSNFQAAFDLAGAYLQAQQTGQALEVLERVLKSPQVSSPALRALLQAYASINNQGMLQATVDKLKQMAAANPNDFTTALVLGEGYHSVHQDDAAKALLDKLLSHPQVDAGTVLQVAQQFATLMDYSRLEGALEKLVKLSPTSPEAWYDLAALKAAMGKTPDALQDLRRALDLSAARHKQDPKALDLANQVQSDARFSSLQQNPEFQQLLGHK